MGFKMHGYLERQEDEFWHCSVCNVRLYSNGFTEKQVYADIDMCPCCKAKISYAYTTKRTTISTTE